MRGLSVALTLSFLAVIDMGDEEAIRKAGEYNCERIFEYTTSAKGAKQYGFYHCPDESFNHLKTVGKWYADALEEIP